MSLRNWCSKRRVSYRFNLTLSCMSTTKLKHLIPELYEAGTALVHFLPLKDALLINSLMPVISGAYVDRLVSALCGSL